MSGAKWGGIDGTKAMQLVPLGRAKFGKWGQIEQPSPPTPVGLIVMPMLAHSQDTCIIAQQFCIVK